LDESPSHIALGVVKQFQWLLPWKRFGGDPIRNEGEGMGSESTAELELHFEAVSFYRSA
jgi:hypothetical protein